MLPEIKPHLCNRCHGENLTVWCFFTLKGKYVQMCASCQAQVLGRLIAKMPEKNVEKMLDNS